MLLRRTMRVPVLGVVRTNGEDSERLELELYSMSTRHRVAVVRGSRGYVLLALAAVGLAAPITPRGLVKNRHRSGVALVGYQPAHRDTKRFR